MYTKEGCSSCESLRDYFESLCEEVQVLSVDRIHEISDKNKRSTVWADLAYQCGETPLVYIDEQYKELDDLKEKASTLAIAERKECDHCKADLLLG